jgi:hypothetical protein
MRRPCLSISAAERSAHRYRQQGYHVLDASTPQAALTIFEQHAREIDLLLAIFNQAA